jgi:hypothetical protein
MRCILKISFLSVILAISLIAPATADSYLCHVATTAPFEVMGQMQPAMADTSITWITDDIVYNETKQGVTIARFDLGMIYTINHSSQTYSEMPIQAATDISALINEMIGEDEDFKAMITELQETGKSDLLEEAKKDFEDHPEMARMFEEMIRMVAGVSDPSEAMFSVDVNPTDETFKYGPWQCRKYLVTMAMPMVDKMTSEIWATEEIDVDYDKFMQASMAMTASWPGFSEGMEEFKKIKGMAVHTNVIMHAMGVEMNITSELVEYKENAPPKGIYDIPDGYEKVDPAMIDAY